MRAGLPTWMLPRSAVLHRIALLIMGILIGAALNSIRMLHVMQSHQWPAALPPPAAPLTRHSPAELFNAPLQGGMAASRNAAALLKPPKNGQQTEPRGNALRAGAKGTQDPPAVGMGTGLADANAAKQARAAGLQFTDKLGMPGDSDNLPGAPLWNASAWHGPPRVSPAQPEWPNTAAICGIMRGEEPDDVAEWLDYHRWIGFDRVFLRENAASVPAALAARLQPYIDSGFLDLGPLPGPKHPLQNRWYNRCSKPDLAGQYSWVAFVDLDEYIVVLEGGKAAQTPDLKAVLRDFKGNAGLSMQWIIFGSSGHVQRPRPGGPLAHYHQCTGGLSFQMKCMANMFYATHHMMVGNTVHDCTYRLDDDGFEAHPVTLADGTPLAMGENTPMTNPANDTALGRSRTYRGHLDDAVYAQHRAITPQHRLALFHYVTRSLEDYTKRKVKLPSGIYTYNYVKKSKQSHTDVADASTFRDFEHDNGFDGEHDVCGSAVVAGYADRCCRAAA